MFVYLHNKFVSAASHQPSSCLCLLDISTAFDTIVRTVFFLDKLLGSASLALFQFCLPFRFFSVKVSSHSKQSIPFSCGVTQGSVLALLAKNSRTNPLHGSVTNLQLQTTLPAHLPSQTFHHAANPFYPIILLSQCLDSRSLHV